MAIAFIGQLPIGVDTGKKEDRSDYRGVPASDRGDEHYGDRGQLGSYSPDEKPYRNPDGVKFNYDGDRMGYAVEAEDLQRGYCEPGIREDPAYDKSNYHDRSSQPRVADEDQGNADFMRDDFEFRGRNRVSRGFLSRPRIPTER